MADLNVANRRTQTTPTPGEQTKIDQAKTGEVDAGKTPETPETVATPVPAEPKPQAAPEAVTAARRHAQAAERARQAAILTRLPVEKAQQVVGAWDPKVAQQTIDDLNGRQSLLEGEKKELGDTMKELGGEIKTLEGKSGRTAAEDVVLESKKVQLQSDQQLDKVLDGRIDQMKRAKGALKFDNFGNETAKNELSSQEASALQQQGAILDRETSVVSQLGRTADQDAVRAAALASAKPTPSTDPAKEAPKTPETTKPTAPPTETPAAEQRILKRGDRGDDVKDLQHQLNENGAHIEEDGKFGPLTLGALSAYQRAHGMRPDGSVGPRVRAAFKQDAAKRAPTTTAPTTTAPTTTAPTTTAPTTTAPTTGKLTPRKGLTKAPVDTKPVEAPKLSDQHVSDAVAAVAAGVGPTKGTVQNAKQIFDAVGDLAPTQLQQVKDAYNKKYGADGWSFDKNVTGAMYPWNQRAMQALEKGDQKSFQALRDAGAAADKQVRADTDALHTAMAGAGTDENAIFSALKKNADNPEMRAAIEKDYKANYGGDLRADLKSELGSVDFLEGRNGPDDVTRANALLDGNRELGSAALLHSLLADGSRNTAVAQQVMTKEIPADKRAAVAEAFRKQYGVSVEDMVQAQPVGTDVKAQLLRAAKDMLSTPAPAPKPTTMIA